MQCQEDNLIENRISRVTSALRFKRSQLLRNNNYTCNTQIYTSLNKKKPPCSFRMRSVAKYPSHSMIML